MRRWKIIKHLTALLPFAIFLLSPVSEPLKKQILNKNDLRWSKVKDEPNRVHRIAVRNGGDNALSKIRIQVTVGQSVGAVSDFAYGPFDAGPRMSFVDSVTNTEALTLFDKRDAETILRTTDRHSKKRSLSAIDNILDDIALSQLRELRMPDNIIQAIKHKTWDHETWLERCRERRIVDSRCQLLDTMFTRSEALRHSLSMSGNKRWRELTGVTVAYANDQICPSGDVYFDLPLGTNESGFLDITYGSGQIAPVVNISAADTNRITKVDLDDLSSSIWKLEWKYHRGEAFIAAGCIILYLIFATLISRPLELRPTYQVFNAAIKTKDADDIWDLAFKKYRYFITVQFRDFVSQTNVTRSLSNEEIFDYLKYRMLAAFGPHFDKFKSDEDLGRYTDQQLKDLVTVLAYAGP